MTEVIQPRMRIRVVHVLPDFGSGGAERMALHLMTNRDRSAFDVAGVSLFDRRQTEIEEQLGAAGVDVWYLGKKRGPDVRVIPRLRSVLQRLDPHIIHTHRYVLRYVLPAVWLLKKRPIVHTVHNMAKKEVDALGRAVHRFAFRSGAVTPVSIAQKVSSSLTELYGIQDPRLIRNGIPTGEYASTDRRNIIRTRLGLREDEIMFLTIGRLEPQKNQRLLLQAFASSFRSSGRPMSVFIAGAGPLEQILRHLARDLGIQQHVRFLGIRTDVPDLLGAADAFVLSSDWEGNPLSVMEAMSAGKPVVATAVGGVPELVDDGYSGLLVPAGAVGEFANAMATLASNPALRDKLGRCAAQVAGQHFDVRHMTRAYEELYLRELSLQNEVA